MENDQVVWVVFGCIAVVGSIFLVFFLAGETISIPMNQYDMNGKQVIWIIDKIQTLIISLVLYAPLVANVLSKLIKRL